MSSKIKAVCNQCNKPFSYYSGSSSGQYCSKSCVYKSPKWQETHKSINIGKKHSDEFKRIVSERFKGIKKSSDMLRKRSETVKLKYDKIGRKANKLQQIRDSEDYSLWRKAIFERDRYACVKCGDNQGGNLEADHIISLSFLYKEAQITGIQNYYDIDNGRTLCTNCHKQTYTYAKHQRHHLESRLMFIIGEDNYNNRMAQIIQENSVKL